MFQRPQEKDERDFIIKSPYMFNEPYSLSAPVYLEDDGYYYMTARSLNDDDDDGIGSLILYRSKLLSGPFEKGPILGTGFKDAHLHLSADGTMFLFFNLIGDIVPERVLLGTIDATVSSSWNDWKMLPGPRLISSGQISRGHVGNATTDAIREDEEVGHPYFLPDLLENSNNSSNNNGKNILSGTLFHFERGKGTAVSRLVIDVTLYHRAVAYRNVENISLPVYRSSSLRQEGDKPKIGQGGKETVLITGVGRSGTMFMCSFFQSVGIQVSHDNNKDCGPYPGPDGAVSWMDAFYIKRRYDRVLHIVRDPLKVIISRTKKRRVNKPPSTMWDAVLKKYEMIPAADNHFQIDERFALIHWIRRNSFVERHASWRVLTETFYTDPLAVWETCMAAGFQERCPDLMAIRNGMDSMPSDLNTRKNKTAVRTVSSWDELEHKYDDPKTKEYIKIAQTMARNYGMPGYENSTIVNYDCGFRVKKGGRFEDWDCFLVEDQP